MTPSDAKQSIIEAAKVLFGEKGFENTSVRDISKRAKTNVAMIAYYFGCKQKLYLSCLHDFAKIQREYIQSILQPASDVADFNDKLQKVIMSLMESFNKDAPLVRMLLRELQTEKKHNDKHLNQITTPFFMTFKNFFQAAIDAKILQSHFSAEVITVLFLGALTHPIHAEIPIKKTLGVTMHDREFQKIYSEHLLQVFTKGVLI